MSIQANGKKYTRVYFNGHYYRTGYYNGKCFLLTPDYNDYLLAGKETYLKSSKDFHLSYKNEPQIVEDRLSGNTKTSRRLWKTVYPVRTLARERLNCPLRWQKLRLRKEPLSC